MTEYVFDTVAVTGDIVCYYGNDVGGYVNRVHQKNHMILRGSLKAKKVMNFCSPEVLSSFDSNNLRFNGDLIVVGDVIVEDLFQLYSSK